MLVVAPRSRPDGGRLRRLRPIQTFRLARQLSDRVNSLVRDKLRTLLKIRVERKTPSFGPRPQPGRTIVRGRNRMRVTATFPDDLWYYLSLLGWREVSVSNDRRRYVDLPSASIDQLARSPVSQREARYRQLLDQAGRIAEARKRGKSPR